MVRRRLGRTGIELSPVGFGAFKIGRNEAIKYAQGYDLPTDAQVSRLLKGLLDLGINYIDTAPAYGFSEERLGRLLHHESEAIISTKVGETFADGRSNFDFTPGGVRKSIDRSRRLLLRETLDIVFIHSSGEDLAILNQTDVVAALMTLREVGLIKAMGFSGKTAEGAMQSLEWADALMVEYHTGDISHEAVIAEAGRRDVGVIVKKPLASGTLPPDQAIPFILRNPHVTSMVIGGLDLDHFRANISIATNASAS
jgi:aryl-alcohol dehydrogenase-like predicted oxidoreductase